MPSEHVPTRITRLMAELKALRDAEEITVLTEEGQPDKIVPVRIVPDLVLNMPVPVQSLAVTQTITVSKKRYIPVTRQNQEEAFKVACLYLLGIVIAETLTTIFIPAVGLILHSLLLLGLLIHYGLSRRAINRHMLAALTFGPLIRIMSLSLPLENYSLYYWYMLIGAPLLLSAFLVTRYIGYRLADIGISLSGLPFQIPIAMTGIGFGYLEYLILRPQPLSAVPALDQIWLPALILLIFTGLLEEVIFRGLMQKAFTSVFGRMRGILYSSFLFAVLHLGYHSVEDLVFVFLVATFFSWAALRTRSILGVALAHGLTNICLFLVFPFMLH